MKKIVLVGLLLMSFIVPAIAEDQPGLKVGTPAPDFEALAYNGETISLSEINKEGPVVLVFYRGGWCVYCNRQLQALQSRLNDFQERGASLVAISVDLKENAKKTVEEKELGFIVVSDPEADLLEMYNLVYKVPDELAKKYKEKYKIDLEAASGRSDHVIAIPATYVIDSSGTIIYAHANRDYKVRPSVDEILKAIK